MRKLLLLAVVAVTLGATAAAAAKTVTVAITTTGYAPKSTTITVGDSVQFFNNTAVVHQVVFTTTTGVTCKPNPIALQPTQAATCKFASAGKYAYSDPSVAGNTFTGTVVVSTPPATSVTLSASSQTLVYGDKVTLSGRVSTHKAGVKVDVLALVCGVSVETPVVEVTTTSGGAYTAEAVPQKNAIYTVQVKGTTNVTSSPVSVSVRPLVSLRKVAPHRYSVRIYAAQSFAGTYASFQRYRAAIGSWVAVRNVTLRSNKSGVAPTVISSGTFTSRINAGLKVRVVLGAARVGSCFLAGTSAAIRS